MGKWLMFGLTVVRQIMSLQRHPGAHLKCEAVIRFQKQAAVSWVWTNGSEQNSGLVKN